MKKISVFFLFFFFAINILATISCEAGDQQQKGKSENYCAQLNRGALMLMLDGKVVKSNVTLKNGTVLTTDGTVIRKDGTKIVLSEGSCVDRNGNIKKPPAKKHQK